MNRSLGALLACQTLLAGGLALSFPFLALYLHRERGLPMSEVGLALALVLAASAASHAFGGEFSDLKGPRRVMLTALVLRGVGSALMAAAMWLRWPIAALIATHVAAGFFGHFFEPGLRTWIAERVPLGQRVRVFGWERIAKNLGWAIGPALGGFVAAKSYPLLFAATAGICALCTALMLAVVDETVPTRGADRFSTRGLLSTASDRRFLEYCLYGSLVAVVMSQLVASLSIHSVTFAGLSEREVGWLFALNGLLVIVLQTPASRRMSESRLTSALMIGSLLYAAGYMMVGFSSGFAAMALAITVVTAGEVALSPSMHAMTVNLAPDRLRGRYVGFHGLSFQLGLAIGPLLGGVALQHLSPRWVAGPWLLVGALGAAASFCFYRFRRLIGATEEGFAA